MQCVLASVLLAKKLLYVNDATLLKLLEQAMGFEPTTPTLARLFSDARVHESNIRIFGPTFSPGPWRKAPPPPYPLSNTPAGVPPPPSLRRGRTAALTGGLPVQSASGVRAGTRSSDLQAWTPYPVNVGLNS
jgi:hypothetical protein